MLFLMESSSSPCTWLALICLYPAAGHQAVGAWCCWRIQSTTSDLAFLLLSASPELHFEKGWIWIPLQCSGCWLVLGAARHALQNHPYVLFMSGWLQTSDLWLQWMIIDISQLLLIAVVGHSNLPAAGVGVSFQVHIYSCSMIRLFWNYLMSLW